MPLVFGAVLAANAMNSATSFIAALSNSLDFFTPPLLLSPLSKNGGAGPRLKSITPRITGQRISFSHEGGPSSVAFRLPQIALGMQFAVENFFCIAIRSQKF
jgi:hypothetical protein